MARAGLDKNAVVERAAQLANEVGADALWVAAYGRTNAGSDGEQ